MGKDKEKGSSGGPKGIVGEMVLDGETPASRGADLVVEPEGTGEEAAFSGELKKTLHETQTAVIDLEGGKTDGGAAESWNRARSLVEEFKPVPWFIWRLSNYVLGKPGRIGEVSEGLVFGLRRLLFAAASDSVVGAGRKVNSVPEALQILKPDVLAAIAVLYAICKRLASRQFERIWRPIMDDAIVRAQIGFYVGSENPHFGQGRGMLAGFAGRCGLAVLISSGDIDQARRSLELLATGEEIKSVGLSIYGCDPLQVSAMVLSASGCGRDAAYGTVAYSGGSRTLVGTLTEAQVPWQAAFTITECVRTQKLEGVDKSLWESLNFCDEGQKEELVSIAKQIVRRGHSWAWLG